MKKALLLLSLLVLTVSLTACGGSSGSSDSTPVTPASLTGAVVAAPISGMDIYIGSEYTTADQDLKIGVTNATGAIEFDKAVVAQIDEYPVVITTRGEAKNAKSKEAFKLELSGIMMSATDSVYLTPFGTIAADLFKTNKRELGAAAAATFAKNAVKDIVSNIFGCDTNPFANPLANDDALMAHEILTQSFMAAMGTTEDFGDTGTLQGKLTTIVTEMNAGKAFNESTALVLGGKSVATFVNDNKADIANKVAKTLTVLTGEEQGTEAADKRREFELQVTVPSFTESVKVISLDAIAGTVAAPKKYTKVSTDIDLFVMAKTNGSTVVSPTAKFKITALPNNGKLTEKGKTAKLAVSDTEFTSASTPAQFTFTPTADVEDYTFTFETIPAAGEKALTTTLTLKAVADKTVIPVSAELTSTVSMFPFASAGTVIAKVEKAKERAFADNDLIATVTFDAISKDATKENVAKAMAVRFTAPTGYLFKDGTKEAKAYYDVLAPAAAVDSSFEAVFEVPHTSVKLLTATDADVDAGKLSFTIDIIKGSDASVEAPNVPFRALNDAKIVLCADDTKNVIQSISIPAGTVIPSVGLLPAPTGATHTFDKDDFVITPVTWNSIAGLTVAAPTFTAVNWKAVLVTPTVEADNSTYLTGFYTTEVAGEVVFATAHGGKISGVVSTETYAVDADTIPFTFADTVEKATIKFVYDPSSTVEGDELETGVFTVNKVAYVAPATITSAAREGAKITATAAATSALVFTPVNGLVTVKVVVSAKTTAMETYLATAGKWAPKLNNANNVVTIAANNGSGNAMTVAAVAGEDAYTVVMKLAGTAGASGVAGNTDVTIELTKADTTKVETATPVVTATNEG